MARAARCQDDACEVFHCRGCGAHPDGAISNYCSRCERRRLHGMDPETRRALVFGVGWLAGLFGWMTVNVFYPTVGAMLLGA